VSALKLITFETSMASDLLSESTCLPSTSMTRSDKAQEAHCYARAQALRAENLVRCKSCGMQPLISEQRSSFISANEVNGAVRSERCSVFDMSVCPFLKLVRLIRVVSFFFTVVRLAIKVKRIGQTQPVKQFSETIHLHVRTISCADDPARSAKKQYAIEQPAPGEVSLLFCYFLHCTSAVKDPASYKMILCGNYRIVLVRNKRSQFRY
jgi:hypothetical protein